MTPEYKPGKQCHDCGQIREDSQPRSYGFYDEAPHEDPRECIRYLRQELESALRRLDSHNL